MIVRASAKINLSLDVVGRRDDGYHLVSMVMQSLYLHDVVTIEPQTREDGIFVSSNLPYIPNDDGNLAYRAARILKEKYDIDDGIKIHLQKRIPVSAGLAGGSTDAAAVLFGVNKLYGLGLKMRDLMTIGETIGADVPFCLMRGTALAENIGERLTRLAPMPECAILLAKPTFGISTKQAYKEVDEETNLVHPDVKGQVEALEQGDLAGVISRMGNVLEAPAIRQYDQISDLKKAMMENGALGSLMSGSGPTVYGVFKDREEAEDAKRRMIPYFGSVRFIVTAPFCPFKNEKR
ncbi:MAG: 4-(cytidine 5'-diphospho)-2-C-methyl-D-erythritol kinase [Lachnospiraceae bacterium]|nr:4-(cytidine 5'-diphospho)-2-C-methyl-D-erythritol kinase [Candidatus Equihabitans merdae]